MNNKNDSEMYHAATKIMRNRAKQLGLDEDELMHFGILGMKWGVRRYQNEDGSLTPEGRLRYLGDNGFSDVGRKEITKRIEKVINKGYRDWSYDENAEKELNTIAKTIAEAIPQKDKDNIDSKLQKWYDAMDQEYDFDDKFRDSKEHEELSNKVMNQVIQQINDDPEFYSYEYAVLTNPKLSEQQKVDELSGLKYFNKAYEYIYGENEDEYKEKYEKNNKRVNPDRLYDSYLNAKTKAVENVLGKEGQKKVKGRSIYDHMKYRVDF